MTQADTAKGLKLIELYRRGVGGERDNAGRLLLRHLRAHDLTLYDLDPSLPVTQDLAALDYWRESASLVARLPGDADGELLSRLVDAPDLTDAELRTVLGRLDLERLVQTRLGGWAHAAGLPEHEFGSAARQVTAEQVLAGQGSVAQRVVQAATRQHWQLTHPERLLRAADPLTQHVILGLVQGVGADGHLVPEGVRAHLSAADLARVRTLIAQDAPRLVQQALQDAVTRASSYARGRAP